MTEEAKVENVESVDADEAIVEPEAKAAAEAYEATEEAAPDWQDKALRLAAEMDNLRKRTARELEDARKYALTGFARDLLDVKDNMERALLACEAEKVDAKMVSEGVKMVAGQLTSTFEKYKIAKVTAVGEELNPDQHQVMAEIEDAEAKPGTIVQEMQAGYTIADRLLRPALVAVAKATSETEKTE